MYTDAVLFTFPFPHSNHSPLHLSTKVSSHLTQSHTAHEVSIARPRPGMYNAKGGLIEKAYIYIPPHSPCIPPPTHQPCSLPQASSSSSSSQVSPSLHSPHTFFFPPTSPPRKSAAPMIPAPASSPCTTSCASRTARARHGSGERRPRRRR